MTTVTVTEAAQPVMRDEVCILLMLMPSACSSWSQNKHNLTVAVWREQSKGGNSKAMAISSNASPFTRRFTVFSCKSGIHYTISFFTWGQNSACGINFCMLSLLDQYYCKTKLTRQVCPAHRKGCCMATESSNIWESFLKVLLNCCFICKIPITQIFNILWCLFAAHDTEAAS